MRTARMKTFVFAVVHTRQFCSWRYHDNKTHACTEKGVVLLVCAIRTFVFVCCSFVSHLLGYQLGCCRHNRWTTGCHHWIPNTTQGFVNRFAPLAQDAALRTRVGQLLYIEKLMSCKKMLLNKLVVLPALQSTSTKTRAVELMISFWWFSVRPQNG